MFSCEVDKSEVVSISTLQRGEVCVVCAIVGREILVCRDHPLTLARRYFSLLCLIYLSLLDLRWPYWASHLHVLDT